MCCFINSNKIVIVSLFILLFFTQFFINLHIFIYHDVKSYKEKIVHFINILLNLRTK